MNKFRFMVMNSIGLVMGLGYTIVGAQDIAPVPTHGKSPKEIIDSAVKDFQGIGGLAERIHQLEFRHRKSQVFVFWFNPYSGRLAYHFHCYVYSPAQKKWTRVASEVFERTPQISVDISANRVGVRDATGKLVYSVAEKKLEVEKMKD